LCQAEAEGGRNTGVEDLPHLLIIDLPQLSDQCSISADQCFLDFLKIVKMLTGTSEK